MQLNSVDMSDINDSFTLLIASYAKSVHSRLCMQVPPLLPPPPPPPHARRLNAFNECLDVEDYVYRRQWHTQYFAIGQAEAIGVLGAQSTLGGKTFLPENSCMKN